MGMGWLVNVECEMRVLCQLQSTCYALLRVMGR